MPEERTYPPLAESRVPHVGTYRRVIQVGLERVYETALDWERLAHVHASCFASVVCDDPSGVRSCVWSPTIDVSSAGTKNAL